MWYSAQLDFTFATFVKVIKKKSNVQYAVEKKKKKIIIIIIQSIGRIPIVGYSTADKTHWYEEHTSVW